MSSMRKDEIMKARNESKKSNFMTIPVRVIAWTYFSSSGGLVGEGFGKVRRGKKDVGGGP